MPFCRPGVAIAAKGLAGLAAVLAIAATATSSAALGQSPSAPAAAVSTDDWRAQGPRSLILDFKVAPSARLTFRSAVAASTLPRLQQLKAQGALRSFHVLANRYLDGPWDLMLVLNFSSSADLARWRQVEATTPGGLDASALQLVAEAETTPSDRMRSAMREGTSRPPVYLVVPYESHASADEYLNYVDGYVAPQLNGWMRDGALDGYDLYFARYYAGRRWSSMLLLAYDGDEGLARRDQAIKAVRERLAAVPEWRKYAEGKQALRKEMEAVVADELTPAS